MVTTSDYSASFGDLEHTYIWRGENTASYKVECTLTMVELPASYHRCVCVCAVLASSPQHTHTHTKQKTHKENKTDPKTDEVLLPLL